ncbi:polysaccharide biosynthesis protein [Candidimonas humi]|uniref:Nucleoside-diphosphate sugar epimerase/dehydratase n=1 Tax=Candidimonas humi TaxID=683355 RepID=A0ABV8NVM2_9BURK
MREIKEALAHRPSLRLYLLSLSRRKKRALQVTADVLLVWVTLWLAFFLRLDNLALIEPFSGHAWLFVLAPVLTIPMFVRFGLYRAVLRYAGLQAIMAIVRAMAAASVLLAVFIYLHGQPQALVPRSIPVLYWMVGTLLVGGLRLSMRHYFSNLPFGLRALVFPGSTPDAAKGDERKRVAIYGAGASGNQLLMALQSSREMRAVAFIDDEASLANRYVGGLKIYAPNDLPTLLLETRAQEVLLAIPSATRLRRNEIVEQFRALSLPVRTIPGIADLATGKVTVKNVRDISIDDLLGRDVVQPDGDLLGKCIRGQVVMVTGAGGSIGSELCRQIMHNGARTLILFEHAEFNLYTIEAELKALARTLAVAPQVVPILGSVRSTTLLYAVMSSWKVDTIYHAAAYKHVPMVEQNIAEGLRNNLYGTLKAAQAALRAGVRNFVLISTDKAVRPTNVMGGTKRLAELVLQALAAEQAPVLYRDTLPQPAQNRTRFTMVRFGNVLGSSGSVIPLFYEQIRKGGPITVTHPEITRYFMTIPEAAQLVIQAGSMGLGGDVFVLDMGEPVKIAQLAQKMIFLSGLSLRSKTTPAGDIAITYTGLRPGEKLYEELLIGDNVEPTQHCMIMRANERSIGWEELKAILDELYAAMGRHDYERIRELFLQAVDGYTPDEKIVDWTRRRLAPGKVAARLIVPPAAAERNAS